MKRTIILLFALAVFQTIWAQDDEDVVWKEASRFTLTGKLFHETPNPYHRVDTVEFKGFTEEENLQVRMSSGIACLFTTDSEFIYIKALYHYLGERNNTNGISTKGFDLYIRQDGEWVWAAAGASKALDKGKPFKLLTHMDGTEHECLLYFPLYSEMKSIKIGVQSGASLKPMKSPFRHRVAVFGSSLTHGAGTSRAGMTYPAIFTRNTGIQMLSLGCSGNCKMQPYFCDVLCKADDIDAFLFDSFANPNEKLIKERLIPFIEKLTEAHPGKPLIFQIPVRRANTNFNTKSRRIHTSKNAFAESMLETACKKYKDVHIIHPCADSPLYEVSVDGTHLDNHGYVNWEKSIENDIVQILSKYGIN